MRATSACLLCTVTHLTAVSGSDLTLLLAFLLTIARWVGVRGWWLRVVGLAGVIIFIALCRSEPSVLRAASNGLGRIGHTGIRQPCCRSAQSGCGTVLKIVARRCE